MLAAGLPAAAATVSEPPVPVQQHESVRHCSAGVGIEERRELPQLHPRKVVFRTDRGHAGNGPRLILDLPPGKQRTVVLTWNLSDADMGL